ncbi:MAG: iron ABC transporter substrate-binding protein, partial [Acidimicrobiales bacterium]
MLAALFLVASLTTACGSRAGGGPGGQSPTTITLYNAQHQQTTDALISAFTKQTGIKVRTKNGSEDVLTAQIKQEGRRSPADVFYT